MKSICKIILALAICTCLALPFAGCDTYSDNPDKNCGGIVDSFNIEEKYIEFKEGDMLYGIIESGYYPELTVKFKQDVIITEHCYCSKLTIYVSDFEKYEETTLEDLLINDDFLNILQEEFRISSIAIEGNTSGATTYFDGTENLAYLLYYGIYDKYTESPTIDNPLEYSGYVKLN